MRRRYLVMTASLAIAMTMQAATYAGRPLVDVIAELQQRGLTVVYSTDLVKRSMRVVAEPLATSDRALLEEILAPYQLAVKEQSGGVLSIVRARNKDAADLVQPFPIGSTPVTLGSIVVTASNYSVLGNSPERRDFLTRDELNRTAHLGDDLFRALSQLPGAAATDYSAAFGVRGGLPQETLVLLDGLEIAAPFHIKYFQNAISVIDSDAIGSLDYLSGGAPAEYGNAMSGVIDMSTATPQQQRRTYAGISFTHARVVSDGTFDGDRGRWLISARRGYFDILLGLFYQDVTARPRYGDVVAKLDYRVSDHSSVSADVLTAIDHIDYDDSGDKIDASYQNTYAWMNLRTAWTNQLSSQSVASVSRMRERKGGSLDNNAEFGAVHDNRSFDIAGLKQDWTLDWSSRNHFAKFGVDLKRFRTSYDYASEAFTREPLLLFVGNPAQRGHTISIQPRGTALAGYVADRVRVLPPLTVEAGMRFEHETWSGGDSALTPRVNFVYTFGHATALRGSWGEYRQVQRLDDISVEDGDTNPYAAQRSRQSEIGIEHRFAAGVLLRGTAYHKTITNVRPRYENLFDRDELFPEIKYDRVRVAPDRARANGVELLLKDDSSRRLTWWVSVAHSTAVEDFGGAEVPRSSNQPNVFSFDLNYRRGSTWNFNAAGLFHNGWPTTRVIGTYNLQQLTLALGPRNGDRLSAYQRLDVRVMRNAVFSRGVFRSWLEVTNVLNHQNPCCLGGFNVDIDTATRSVAITPQNRGIGWLPSFGVAWEF